MHEFLLNHAGVANDDESVGDCSVEDTRNRILALAPSVQNEGIRLVHEL